MNGSSSWKTLKIDFPGAVSRGTHAQVCFSLSLSLFPLSLGCIDFHLTLLASPAANSNQPFIQNRRKRTKNLGQRNFENDKRTDNGTNRRLSPMRRFDFSFRRSVVFLPRTSILRRKEPLYVELQEARNLYSNGLVSSGVEVGDRRYTSTEIWKRGHGQKRDVEDPVAFERFRKSGKRVKSVKREKTETFSTLKVSRTEINLRTPRKSVNSSLPSF